MADGAPQRAALRHNRVCSRFFHPILQRRRQNTMSADLFNLSGRSALITGGGRGLGKAMARGFAQAGADVFLASRTESELQAAAAEVADGLDVKVEWMGVDMTDRDQVDGLAREAVSRLGKIDILVNNAGTNIPAAIDDITDDGWDQVVELNLSACMRLMRALIPAMKERGWGRVINISSILGLAAKATRNVYCATKFGLIGLTQAAALDVGESNVTVNAIAPGPFLTELPGRLLTEEQRKQFAERTALGRWGRPEELVGPALMMASDAGSYVTGTCLTVDGGVLARGI